MPSAYLGFDLDDVITIPANLAMQMFNKEYMFATLDKIPSMPGLSIVAILVITMNTFVTGLPVAREPLYMLMSLALSCCARSHKGPAAGISPAMRAAERDPIEALR